MGPFLKVAHLHVLKFQSHLRSYLDKTTILLIPTVIAILLHSMHGESVEYNVAFLVLPALPNITHCIMALASA